MKRIVLTLLLPLMASCGYHFNPKEITLWDAKGDKDSAYSCGSYMHVSSNYWSAGFYDVSFTDNEGLAHDIYGVKAVTVSDIPATIDAPMWGFTDDFIPGTRFTNPDGTPGAEIKEGDIAVKGENKARLVNGKWTPVKVPNPACAKQTS